MEVSTDGPDQTKRKNKTKRLPILIESAEESGKQRCYLMEGMEEKRIPGVLRQDGGGQVVMPRASANACTFLTVSEPRWPGSAFDVGRSVVFGGPPQGELGIQTSLLFPAQTPARRGRAWTDDQQKGASAHFLSTPSKRLSSSVLPSDESTPSWCIA